MRLLQSILLAIVLVVPAVSAADVENIENAPVNYEVSAEQVKKAIMFAGVGRGWKMTEEQPGVIKAVLDIRKHQAVVQIDYTDKAYSITYLDSTELLDRKGRIHKNYYRWINNLKTDIDKLLFKYSYPS